MIIHHFNSDIVMGDQMASMGADQNFWYLSSFLLRMFSMGPKILLKAFLSMLTILTVVRAFTLACLGMFLTRAISPK